MQDNKTRAEIQLAAEAIANAEEVDILPPAVLEKAEILVNTDVIDARNKVGKALIGKSVGLAIASNLQMREQLENVAKVLTDEIINRPVPENNAEETHRLLDLKVKASAGMAILASKHTELTKELTDLALVKAHADRHKRQKRVAPQVFLGTNYIQNNINPKPVDNKPKKDDTKSE